MVVFYPPADKDKEIKCAVLFGYTSLYISAPKGQKTQHCILPETGQVGLLKNV